VAAVVLGVALLAVGKPASTGPARTADRQSGRRVVSLRHDRPAAVRCPRPIEPRMTVRCNVLNPSGAVQLILVTLTRSGELGVDVP
jgi:hypothetical protein